MGTKRLKLIAAVLSTLHLLHIYLHLGYFLEAMESICSYSDFYVLFLLPKFIEKNLKVGILEIPILHLMLEMLSSFLVNMQENALARFCGLRNCYSTPK